MRMRALQYCIDLPTGKLDTHAFISLAHAGVQAVSHQYNASVTVTGAVRT